VKNPSDPIGNRTLGLPVCSATSCATAYPMFSYELRLNLKPVVFNLKLGVIFFGYLKVKYRTLREKHGLRVFERKC
jgi:uncharacterized membrane protein